MVHLNCFNVNYWTGISDDKYFPLFSISLCGRLIEKVSAMFLHPKFRISTSLHVYLDISVCSSPGFTKWDIISLSRKKIVKVYCVEANYSRTSKNHAKFDHNLLKLKYNKDKIWVEDSLVRIIWVTRINWINVVNNP